MPYDFWLDRWIPLLKEKSSPQCILEIGCGFGDDTEVLVASGFGVMAFDHSQTAVDAARDRAPFALIEQRDLRQPFADGATELAAVVASLSIHYFPWPETQAIARRVWSSLRPGGIFLCRVNSTEDRNFGATGHPEIEKNYYSVNGEPKRFFDEESIDLLFGAEWRRLSIEQLVTLKYGKPKQLWEIVLERPV